MLVKLDMSASREGLTTRSAARIGREGAITLALVVAVLVGAVLFPWFPSTASLDVGAAVGTDVYSPVDGTIVGITTLTLRGQTFGSRIDIQPTSAPALVVRVTHLRPDPALTVGSSVAASISKIGTIIDFSQVEQQALARYTQDAGNHVSFEIHPAATLATP